jgi:xylulose-5-phosphate/fructose-6-phosphate phosphoketolase
MNKLDRLHLADDVLNRLPQLGAQSGHLKQLLHNKLVEHRQYVREHGDDMPEIRNWEWKPN